MYSGVLDPQNGKLVFGLWRFDAELLREEFPMHPRESADVAGLINRTLAARGIEFADIKEWTFGAGPGSFTFLRVISALGAGWSVGRDDFRFRCVPGAFGYAYALNMLPGERAVVLYDARNEEILACGVTKTETGMILDGAMTLLDKEKAPAFFAGLSGISCVCDEADLASVQDIAGIFPVKAVSSDISGLYKSGAAFDNKLIMRYLRPAVNGFAD